MRTEVRLQRTDDGVRVHTRTGTIAPKIVATTANSARVALVATRATLLASDDVTVDIAVDEGLTLHVDDIAATVAYDGRDGPPARWTARVSVATDATFTWLAQPFVVATGADVRRRIDIDVAGGARALLRDTVVLGRSGELGGRLACRTRVAYDDTSLLAEDLTLDGATTAVDDPAVRGEHHVIDQLLAVGWRPAEVSTVDVYNLAGPGRLARHLGTEAHASPIASLAETWMKGG